MNDKRLGAALVILSGVCWGTNAPTLEHLTNALGANLYMLVTYRFLLASCVLFVISFATGRISVQIFKEPKDLLVLSAFALGGIMFAQVFYFYAVSLTGSAIATVIQYSAPAFISLIICIEQRSLPTFTQVVAFLLVLLGVFLLVGIADFGSLKISPFALFCCILCTIGAVANALVPRRINAKYGPTYILALSMFFCGVLLFILRPSTLEFSSALAWLEFGQIVLVGTVLPFACYMIGLLKIGADRSAILGAGVPLVAALLGYFWHGENLLSMQWLGFGLILIAIFLRIVR